MRRVHPRCARGLWLRESRPAPAAIARRLLSGTRHARGRACCRRAVARCHYIEVGHATLTMSIGTHVQYLWHKKLVTLLDLCVSSLRRGHANLLCIVPILADEPRRESDPNYPIGTVRPFSLLSIRRRAYARVANRRRCDAVPIDARPVCIPRVTHEAGRSDRSRRAAWVWFALTALRARVP